MTSLNFPRGGESGQQRKIGEDAAMKSKSKDGKKRTGSPQQSPSGSRKPQQQQHAGSGEGKQYGEGNYAATRQYNEGVKEHVQNHDIEREARDAAPRSAAEEKEMENAERIGRSRARGDGKESPDDPQNEQDLIN
jgi:hypothetical protein